MKDVVDGNGIGGHGRGALSLMIAGAFFASASGCATTPVPAERAARMPNERLYAFQSRTDKTTSTIVITRDAGTIGHACYIALYINGMLAARYDPAETATFYVEPGELLLRVGNDPQGLLFCALGQEIWTQKEASVGSQETKRFRILVDKHTDIVPAN